MALALLPAVDIADGHAVRLVQGAAGSETSYGSPVEAALNWQEQGAEWIHLVDLDAAFGRGDNRTLLVEVTRRLEIAVELSGGIRDDASLAAALATGAARVNIGTAALENPEWVRKAISEYGDRIAVGLDVRGTTLAARGWTQSGGELFDVLARLDADGCALGFPEPPHAIISAEAKASRTTDRRYGNGRTLISLPPSAPGCCPQ